MSVSRKLIAVSLGGVLLCAHSVSADLVRLKQGGELRGEVLDQSAADGGLTTIRTLSGAIVSVAQGDVDFVQRRSALIEEYVTRARVLPDTVDAHWELAEWCRTRQLVDQRKEQLERLLDLDPDHDAARRILGYVRHVGRWMTKEDMMAERGYLRHEGRWVTRQELELLQKNSVQHTAELDWMPKIRLWLAWMTGLDSARRDQGLAQLLEIRDPNAIPALKNFLSDHADAQVRRLLVRILGQIEGPRSLPLLVHHLLIDPDHVVRQDAFTSLSPARYGEALPLLIKGLQNKSNPVVCRAAEVLMEIGDTRAVPALIDALVTTHAFQVQVPSTDGVSFSQGGVGGNRAFSGYLPPDVEIMARTGQLPYGVSVLSDPSTPRLMKTVTVTVDVKNAAVLSALEKLTGRNLGYNEREWHVWWAIQKG